MTYEELQKAYEAAMKKCSELESEKANLEKENADLKQSNENKDLRIEHLTELVLKRNKMLFGQKSEKGKYICDGQMLLDGGIINEAEAESNLAAPEPTVETVTKSSKKTGQHRGRKEIRADLETRNQKEKLHLFLTHPGVEMTNNLAERTVKPYVINRKNFLFSDTEKGADVSAAVMSIIETAKRNNLDVYGYLLYLLTVLPEKGTDPTDDQIKSVMPWSFSLPAYCRQTYSEIQ